MSYKASDYIAPAGHSNMFLHKKLKTRITFLLSAETTNKTLGILLHEAKHSEECIQNKTKQKKLHITLSSDCQQ